MTAIIPRLRAMPYRDAATCARSPMRHLPLAALLLLAATPALAQHGGHQHGRAPATPYAGFQNREASGLDPQEVADLRAGRGMGFALPAELNGYPGPMHVLELADRLALTAAQRARMEALRAAMLDETRPLGEALIAAERALDAVFARGTATAAEVDAASEAAALARGRVRAAHLRVHLATRDALTPAQVASYARLRGTTR
jgi:Spy/CpxP family protein refolding chaperone